MDSKLVEEIEEYLRKHKEQLPDFAKETQLTRLLQRCLESLRWIPVSEEMPKDRVHVLLYRANEDYALPGYLDGHNFFALTADIGKSWHSGVTHWMPLPAIPQ